MLCRKDISGLGLTNLAEAIIDYFGFLDPVTNHFCLIWAINATEAKRLNLILAPARPGRKAPVCSNGRELSASTILSANSLLDETLGQCHIDHPDRGAHRYC